jgi:hypothetical protein
MRRENSTRSFMANRSRIQIRFEAAFRLKNARQKNFPAVAYDREFGALRFSSLIAQAIRRAR